MLETKLRLEHRIGRDFTVSPRRWEVYMGGIWMLLRTPTA